MRLFMRLPSPADLFRTFIPFVLTLLLGACVTVTHAPDPLKAEPRDDAGTVVVSVTANTGEINGFNRLAVKRINAPDVNVVDLNSLNLIAPGLARDTSVFIGMLREGEYEIGELIDTTTNHTLSLNAGGRELLGRFKVTRGQTADLGRLVLTPVNYKVVMGRSAKVTSNKTLIEQFAPEYAKLFSSGASGGWVTARTEADAVEPFALSHPVGFDNPVELDDGTIVGGSRLGSVLVRPPSGKWSAIRSPGLESLLCVMPVKLPDTRLLAVGEFNTILRQSAVGRPLVPVKPGNLPPGNLLYIAGEPTHGWYLVQQRKQDITIYHSAVLENGDWREVRKESVGLTFWSGKEQLWVWRTAQGFSYAVSDGRINHLDYATGQWRTVKSPNDSRFIQVAPNPDGSIGILTSPGGGFGGVFASTFLSQDQGATWREIIPKDKIKTSPPVRLRSGTILLSSTESAFSGKFAWNGSYDEGLTWQAHGPAQPATTMTPLTSGRLLYTQYGRWGTFSVNLSSDEGKSWRMDYSNYDSWHVDKK
jgi:hypothetical protein